MESSFVEQFYAVWVLLAAQVALNVVLVYLLFALNRARISINAMIGDALRKYDRDILPQRVSSLKSERTTPRRSS